MTYILLLLLMLIAGAGIPVMAAINTGLGVKIGSPYLAVAIMSASVLMVAALCMAVWPKADWTALKSVPPLYFSAGLFFLLYILSIGFTAPRIGLGTAVFMVLAGQLISSTVIDHFGLFGNPVQEITPRRIAGLVLFLIGVAMARSSSVAAASE